MTRSRDQAHCGSGAQVKGPPSETHAPETGSRSDCPRAAAASSAASSESGRGSAGRCAWRRSAARRNAGLARDRAAHQRRADRVEHLRFRTLDDGHERKHVFLLRRSAPPAIRSERRSAAGSRASFLTSRGSSRCLAVTSVDPARLQVRRRSTGEIASATPGTVNAARPAFGSSGGSGVTRPSRCAMRLGDLPRVPAGPDAGAVDAAAAAVQEHAVDHHVEILLPVDRPGRRPAESWRTRARAPARADCRCTDRPSPCRQRSGCGRTLSSTAAPTSPSPG